MMRPSTYVPLSRRFLGSERDRELAETRELYARVKAHHDAWGLDASAFCRRFYGLLARYPKDVAEAAARALWELVDAETQMWELPEPSVERMTMEEYVEYRNLLYAKQHFLANRDELLALFEDGLTRIFEGILSQVPQGAGPSPFSIPLCFAMDAPKLTIDRIWGTLSEFYPRGLFKSLAIKMHYNICEVSGRDPNNAHSSRPIIMADESDLAIDEAVGAYLGGTPFFPLFAAPVPLKLEHETRFGHMHIVGGSGSGKTTLIENLIQHDLQSDDPPSIVLIDPHSDLVRKLMRSNLGHEDRLILIDPRDTRHPLALNPFALNRARLDTYDDVTREQVTAGVIETFGYLWSGLTNLHLTGKQEVLFRYVTRLMLAIPDALGRNATILDMLELMRDPAPYQAAIETLPPIPRAFFEHDFRSKGFDGTREQISYRLQAIIENPTMARLFTAPETKLDFFTELNRGAIILVDTAKDFLKEGSGVFGKLIVSFVLQAIMERAAIAPEERKPTFVIIDEAGSFFSSNIDDMLTEARKYRAGMVLAHQYLDQASASLRASLAANTAIKLASGLSSQDAHAMARDMRTSADQILSQPKWHFATFVKNVTPSAISLPVPSADRLPRLSEDEYQRRIARNRERVSVPLRLQIKPPEPLPASQPALPDEDISRDW